MSGKFTYSGLYALTPEQKARLEEVKNKLDKAGHEPNKYLGTDENGNVVPKSAPSGSGAGLTPEQEQKLGEIDNKLDQSQLQSAINQALQQAQQSGLFDGQDGQTPQLSIGTVTTLDPGSQATASITGTVDSLKLNLGIPRGTDGSAGENGGYYTPQVTEITPGEYQITFKASAPAMPSVGPVQLTLPSGGGATADQVQQAVNQALENAKQSGDFDGPTGADGGHYTPEVTQPDPDHLKFDFTASKPGMPPVDSVTVNLPKGTGGGGSGSSGGNIDIWRSKPGKEIIIEQEVQQIIVQLPNNCFDFAISFSSKVDTDKIEYVTAFNGRTLYFTGVRLGRGGAIQVSIMGLTGFCFRPGSVLSAGYGNMRKPPFTIILTAASGGKYTVGDKITIWAGGEDTDL